MPARSLIVIACFAVVASGCGTDLPYFAQLAAGELNSIAHTRPIDQVLADGSLTPQQADKLRLVQRVREFALTRIGLTAGADYTVYEDNNNEPAAYAVSASPKDRLQPYQWVFPIVGATDVKGFFDRSMAEAEVANLEAQGFDAFIGQAEGFSTLGILPDPVRATNLDLDDYELAELILHELTHTTIYKPSDTDFDESIAEFVGRTAALQFYVETSGRDSPDAIAARQRFEDFAVIDAYVIELYQRLGAFYGQPISSDEKIAGRQAIFDSQKQRFTDVYLPQLHNPDRFAHVADIPLNNAAVLAGTRYQNGLDLYQQVFDRLDHDYAALLDVLRQAAAEQDSRGFLIAWLAQSP